MGRLRSFIIPFAITALAALSVAAARGQSLPGFAVPTASPGLPPGIRNEGIFRTAPIGVDGNFLFRIATAINPGGDQMSAEMRQQYINAAIAQLLALRGTRPNSGTIYDPASLRVAVQHDGSQALIVATDKHHTTPFPILTVTATDAKYQRTTVDALAAQWRATLQTALVAALQKRQPAQIKANLRSLVVVGAALLALSLLALVALWALRRRIVALRRQVAHDAEAIDEAQFRDVPEKESATHTRRRLGGLTVRAADPAMRLTAARALATIVVWGTVLAWFLAIVWALNLFPQTTPLSNVLMHRVRAVVIIAIVALLLVRVADVVVTRLARLYGENARFAPADEGTRLMLRVPTIARAASAMVAILVAIVALMAALGAAGISTGSVLTLGGIAALGITFAAQNLLRDFLNGFFVLVEDQYVVGDYVTIGAWSGVVEAMTLRVVQLRDSAGNLITIPHGQADQVVNSSRDWSRVDFRIGIDADADADAAVALLQSTIEDLAREDPWMHDGIVFEWCGIDSVGSSGLVVRASLKTAPLRQFEVKREINARIIHVYRKAGIAFGVDPKSGVQVHVVSPPRPA